MFEWGRHVFALLAVAALASVGARGAVPAQLDMPLLKQVTSSYGDNQAISPFLITNALSQVWVGARGATRSELASKTGITGLGQLTQSYPSVNQALSAPSRLVTTAVFNRVYIRHQFSVKMTFITHLQNIFGIDVKTFHNAPAAVTAINTDVAQVTKNRIQQLVTESALRSAELVLVSALYFKGSWLQQFTGIGNGRFLTAAGDRQVPMMTLRRPLPYLKLNDFDVVELPYKHPDYSMLIFRPDGRSLGRVQFFHSMMGSIDVAGIYGQLLGKSADVKVTMPKFKIESDYSLKGDLLALEIRKIFSPSQADFSGISATPLVVDDVIHKVFMEVTEEGTEAAGAVAVGFSRSAFRPPPVDFIVDRPFLAVLYHNKQHVNLFSAWVASPEGKTAPSTAANFAQAEKFRVLRKFKVPHAGPPVALHD